MQAIGVFYIGVLQLATTVLQGHNNAHRPVINLVVGACVKVGLTPLLVRAFGIIGAAGATAACYAVADSVKLLVFAEKARLYLVFGIKCLYDAQSAKGFFYIRHQHSPLCLSKV